MSVPGSLPIAAMIAEASSTTLFTSSFYSPVRYQFFGQPHAFPHVFFEELPRTLRALLRGGYTKSGIDRPGRIMVISI
jgi:hypothetical protein